MTLRFSAAVAAIALSVAPSAAYATTDVMFVMDSSGSLSTVNFATEKSFVNAVIDQIAGVSVGAGVVQFATTNKTLPIVALSSPNRTKLQADITALTHMAQSTYTLNALNATVGAFNTYGNPSNRRLAFIITDGVPSPSSQNPCGSSVAAAAFRTNYAAAGITAYLLTIGDSAVQGPLSCLTDNGASGRVLSLQTTADLSKTTTSVAAIINGTGTALSAVPEPATWAMMIAGFTLIGSVLRRRRGATPTLA